MKTARFSTVILTLVLALLAICAVILLTPAYQGSEQALQREIRLGYERDQRTLSNLLDAQFRNIELISRELTRIRQLQRDLTNDNRDDIAALLQDLLSGPSGQHIDAFLITDRQGQSITVQNPGLIAPPLALASSDNAFTPPGSWTTVKLFQDKVRYNLLRLNLPIVDERSGEVVGRLSTFVLLNGNYWIINGLQRLFGSEAIALTDNGQVLDSLEHKPGQLDTLLHPKSLNDGLLTTSSSILRSHDLHIDHSDRYTIRSLLPNQAYLALQNAYVSKLGYALLIVVILGVGTMLLIKQLIQRSLMHLTLYAEQVPKNGEPIAFSGGRFHEFIRVGKAVERMLVRVRDHDKSLASIVENSPDPMFIKDPEGRYQLVSARLAALFNQLPEQMTGQVEDSYLRGDALNQARASDQEVLDFARPVQYECQIPTTRGLRSFLVSKFPILDAHGMPSAIGAISTDITDSRRIEDQLQLAHQVFGATAEAIIVLDEKQNVLSSNRAFSRMFECYGRSCASVIDRFLTDQPLIAQQLRRGENWQGECTLVRDNAEAQPLLVSITQLPAINDDKRSVLLFSDITKLKQAEQKLQQLAHYDSLTGLPNRGLFHQRLKHRLEEHADASTAVLFIDIDNFKSINDNHGHAHGDQLLHQIADRLRSAVQARDTVARLGGDEFTVILCDIEQHQMIETVAKRILKVLHDPYDLDNIHFFSSASIGIAIAGIDGSDAETLIHNADLAMYEAKLKGRNSIHFFDPAITARYKWRQQLEDGLHDALSKDQLILEYQPRFDIGTMQAQASEALIRWQHPVHGLIPPGEFIPIAEESELIVDIGRYVLHHACQDAARLYRDGCALCVSVNLSPRQLHSPELVEDITTALSLSGLPPQLLELEITETQVMENIDQSIPVLNQIRALGVRLAVDDFGTGYSSLMYLKKLPVDTVKIDRSFIRDVPGDTDDEHLVQAIISMSHSLRLKVVAEGVETEAQMEFLRERGCDELQGFLLARPGSLAALREAAVQPV